MRTKSLTCCCFLGFGQLLQAASSQGYVVEWGWNTASARTIPATCIVSNAVAISAGRFQSLALKSNGTVVQWGGNFRDRTDFYNTVLTTGEGSSGNARVVTNAKTIISNGVVRINGAILSNIMSIAAGNGFSLALKENGTVVTWGENYVPEGLSNIVGIAADDAHSWVLKGNGAVAGWYRESSPRHGLLTVDNLSNVTAIWAHSTSS